MNIRVKPGDAKAFTLGETYHITEKTTVGELKQKIADRVGHQVDHIRFLSSAKELTADKDHKTLAEMEIVDFSLINIVYRLRGGAMIKLKVQLFEDPNKIIEVQVS